MATTSTTSTKGGTNYSSSPTANGKASRRWNMYERPGYKTYEARHRTVKKKPNGRSRNQEVEHARKFVKRATRLENSGVCTVRRHTTPRASVGHVTQTTSTNVFVGGVAYLMKLASNLTTASMGIPTTAPMALTKDTSTAMSKIPTAVLTGIPTMALTRDTTAAFEEDYDHGEALSVDSTSGFRPFASSKHCGD